jgi:hypothetical protein
MRDLERDKQKIFYSQFLGKQPILDENGDDTGESMVTYSNPQEFRICVSTTKNSAENEVFGINLDYDRTMSTHDKTFPITEESILWIDKVPVLNEDGSIKYDAKSNMVMPNDYTVKAVGTSQKSTNALYAIKKVTGTA